MKSAYYLIYKSITPVIALERSTLIAMAQDAAMTHAELQLAMLLLGPWVRRMNRNV
jgi:hypothetical protein